MEEESDKMAKKIDKETSSKGSKKKSSQDPKPSEKEIHYHYHLNGHRPSPGGYYYGSYPQESGKPGEVHYHYYYEPPRRRVGRSSKPTIAGSLLILRAVLAIAIGIFFITAGSIVGDLGEGIPFVDEDAKGDITGTVTLQNGTPVQNVTISIVGETISTQTDKDGNYVLFNVPTGNQKIKVEKEGYDTIIYKAFISPSEFNVEEKNGEIKIESKEDNTDNNPENDFDFVLTPGNGEIERGTYPPFEWIGNFMFACAIIMIISAVFQLIGGIFAIKRERYGLTIVCAILGVISFSILAIIALLILILSKDEFKKSEEQVNQ